MDMTVGEFLGIVFRWFCILSWRFFTGAHMNGQTYNDATWWRDASPGYRKRRQNYGWWKKKSRMKRVAWRHSFFWPTVLIIWGFEWSPASMVFLLGIFGPVGLIIGWRKLRFVFFAPVVAHGSDGSVTQEWSLRPRYRRLLKKFDRSVRRRPGLARPEELQPGLQLVDVPADYDAAVRAELAEELDGAPGTRLKLLLDPSDFEEVRKD